MTQINFQAWSNATAELPWGVQQAFHTALSLASEEKLTLTYGADYGTDNAPCLVNATATMLAVTNGQGGHGKPSKYFRAVVNEFDRLNQVLAQLKVNTETCTVSPLAAEILIANFGTLKEKPVPQPQKDNPFVSTPEIPDEALELSWYESQKEVSVEDIMEALHGNPWDERPEAP